ncbi:MULTISPECIES: UDP-glucose dehydrogenase family protein [Amycolatopsis]|uniref:UDP-glucose 6-dehydrogenase n=1 Tax=Amycolatopsis thermalba TaxID=944492 RepID=A0ABY4NVR9_9PSEU|nr:MULTISPECIES: UDP-glucose/GDP-mannose dehydrogenase family protein [Amycolatopsis]OXM71780.1 UDP-glucose 6-dehydrogenase [Amycolatopsis sp. KNN50.9b]UQS24159.1 UDP-glucose/GDP-mannose dehydrogenase family protein [Amycolatopsis thermalba]
MAAVGVAGAGYVGLTTAACLAALGHDVVCTEVDESKVARLSRGEVELGEPELAPLVRDGLAAGRLRFTADVSALDGREFVFACVPTPTGPDGSADLSAVEAVLAALRPAPHTVLVVKSTVPVGTCARIAGTAGIAVVSNPEFLREGHAVHDFRHPDRIVLGGDPPVVERVATLYAGLDAPVVRTGHASAELGKYASNAFLALKLSYVNLLARLCERTGADIDAVTRTMSLDERIGPHFLHPGPGWGGSCLPKDTRALVASAAAAGVDLTVLRSAIEANDRQYDHVVARVREAAGGRLAGVRIGVFGLAFKAGTSDLRDSPALAVAGRLADAGAVLTGYDPGVGGGDQAGPVQRVDDPVLAAKGARVLVVLTEWPEFTRLDWSQLAAVAEGDVVVDTRGVLDPAALRGSGLRCVRLGHPA